jgi:hypothetical protein
MNDAWVPFEPAQVREVGLPEVGFSRIDGGLTRAPSASISTSMMLDRTHADF